MQILMTVFFIILVLGSGVGGFLFWQFRNAARETKNFERGLKMVTLLIHLPPPSEDTAINGRDSRDVMDETISKAQIIYNIIGSTVKKGFSWRYIGQRHFGFEIVGTKGFVYFYASVPVTLVEVVKQAVVSAYPSARLEEVADPNIFNPVGKIIATTGGEMVLKDSFAYPIATYQETKRDALQSVLNALGSLEKEDGAGIQILMRPADSNWRKKATTFAGKKRKGTDKNGFAHFLRQILTAFVKPPEDKKDGGNKKELSSLEQATLDAIDDKTRHQGYEVLIRIVVSSNISQRSQAILNNIVASFSLFDAPGKNGFKFVPSKNIEELASDYILRMFPQNQTKNILNAVELATLFHFPEQSNMPTSQVTRQDSKQVDGPRNIPDEGLLLGYNVFRGVKKPIRIGQSDRQRHMYVVGQTGTGKSTFLENLAFQDMVSGNGFAFVDPHGDTAEKLLAMVPRERTEDLIYFSPSDMDFPMGVNLFEFHSDDQKDFLIQEALNMLQKLYDPQHQGIMGPRYEHLFRNAALTVMADPAGGTFVDIPKLFRDPAFVKQKLQYVKDQNVLEFWQKEMPQSQRSNEFGEVVSWFVSKFGAFLSNEMMRNIIGQTKSSFDLRDIMDNKKILLVNLSKGRLGDLNSKLLGMIFVMKFQAAAMSRATIPEEQRVDFSLYVDEFQNFSTDSFATIMSEARKYHLNLLVGNQFTTQLTPEIRDAVFGNMGTIVSFRIGQNDVESLGKYFNPTFDADDLLRVPNHNTIIRTLISGVPTQPFSMATLPPFGTPNSKLADALKQLSAAKYGRPRAAVEAEIFERMKTKAEPAPAFGAPAANIPAGAAPRPGYAAPAPGGQWQPPAAPTVPAQMPAGASGASFLDEWLTRRQNGSVAAVRNPSAVSGSQQWGGQPAAGQFASPPAASGGLNPPFAGSSPTVPQASPAAKPSQASSVAGAADVANPVKPLAPAPALTPVAPLTPDLTSGSASDAGLAPAPVSTQASVTPITSVSEVLASASSGLADNQTDDKSAAAPPVAPDKSRIVTQDRPAKPQPAASNVSEEQVQHEVENITRELKQHLAASPAKPAASRAGDVPGDTIFIDNDGNLHEPA